MESDDVLREQIKRLSTDDCAYVNLATDVRNIQINLENLGDLEILINLFEMHEEALKQTRRALMLKQQTCLMEIMATYSTSHDN